MSRQTTHGVLLNVNNTGTLITGLPGSGKSSLALSLLDRGHTLIADDIIHLINKNQTLIGQAHPSQSRLLSVRHLGLIDVTQHFGAKSFQPKSSIDLIIELSTERTSTPISEPSTKTQKIQNFALPVITIPIASHTNLAILVECAAREFQQKKLGLNTAKTYETKQLIAMNKKQLKVQLMSFGHKFGMPDSAHLVLDCRSLPNPFWVDALQKMNGKDQDVVDFIDNQPETTKLKGILLDLITTWLEQIHQEDEITIALGCTGGQHRSVYMVESLAKTLISAGRNISIVHREEAKWSAS